jgi:CheY-like chemotaxis protein
MTLVVMVEDHPLQGRLLRQALRESLPGCTIEHFADGLVASRRLADPAGAAPDLLVLDLALPGRSGHDLLGERARDARLAGIPAVVVTSSEAAADRDRSLALGADLHLIKPVDTDGFSRLAERLASLVAERAR